MVRCCQKLFQSAVQLQHQLLLQDFAELIKPYPLLSTHLLMLQMQMHRSAAHSAVLNALALTKSCIAMQLQAILTMQRLDYLLPQQTFHSLVQAIKTKLLVQLYVISNLWLAKIL
jgi:hypothetical protein